MTKLNGIHQQILQRMREQILDSLKNGPRMVNDISDELDCSRSTIDKRLHELKEDGVVVCTKQSRRGIGGWHQLCSPTHRLPGGCWCDLIPGAPHGPTS
jgi:biotin operon repressor